MFSSFVEYFLKNTNVHAQHANTFEKHVNLERMQTLFAGTTTICAAEVAVSTTAVCLTRNFDEDFIHESMDMEEHRSNSLCKKIRYK